MFSFMLRSCPLGILAYVLDPTVPIVWIRRHTPKKSIQWWNTQTRLSEAGVLHDVEVRCMEFDIQLNTTRFLELLPEFRDDGMVLFQMTRRVPETLTLDGMAEDAFYRILIQNGLHLHIYLPYEAECGQLASPHREVLVRILQRPEVKEIAFGAGS